MKITEFNKLYKDVFPVGEGWRPLVTNLVNDIIAISPNVDVQQVKEKFGGLRFYIFCGDMEREEADKIYNLIDQAESESLEICELCGGKEGVKQYGSWIKTHCKQCREAIREKA